MVSRAVRITAAMAAGGLISLAAVHGVSAHDVHPFGKYTIALGWVHEPAYVGFDNAVQVLVKDDKGNPLKIKGVGELGICGAGACIGAAIFNATGVRLRDYPFTPDKIFPQLPTR